MGRKETDAEIENRLLKEILVKVVRERSAVPESGIAQPTPEPPKDEPIASAPIPQRRKPRGRPVKAASEKEPEKTDWTKVYHTCPHCLEKKAVDPHFGVHLVRGRIQKYSWCRKCRAGTNYYNQPRKYQTKGTGRRGGVQ